MDFEALIRDISANNWNIFGIEVYSDGQLIHGFGDTVSRHPIYSATKSITSIAVGMALDDGKLEIDRSVLDYLPNRFTNTMLETQRKAYQHITIRRLLTMSVAGFPFRAGGKSWLADSLSYPIDNPEAQTYNYSNIPAYLVGVAVSCAVDEDLYSYLKRKLFDPLDIKAPPYARCPDGYFYGASSMELSVNELSRIGLLLCDRGSYGGKQIISASYVDAATSIQQMNREGGYGYFFWKYHSGFSISGKWKQKCLILPDQRLVIAFLSHIEEDVPQLMESLERHLL